MSTPEQQCWNVKSIKLEQAQELTNPNHMVFDIQFVCGGEQGGASEHVVSLMLETRCPTRLARQMQTLADEVWTEVFQKGNCAYRRFE